MSQQDIINGLLEEISENERIINILRRQRIESETELTQAIRYTVEYVGMETLPPVDGWSWYDALKKYDPEVAHSMRYEYLEYKERNK